MPATRLDKIMLTQVMRRENEIKDMKLIQFLEVNVTSIPAECF